MPPNSQTGWTVVWDPFVRFGHWALVAAFAIAWLSGDDEAGDPELLHVWSGYAVGIIVALRIVWGFVGPRHARFSDFVHAPAATFRYAYDLVLGRARRYLGHSPAGGAMIIALLVCLAGTVGTGLIEYGDRGKGPLAAAVGVVIVPAYADRDENHGQSNAERRGESAERERVIGELHGALANITLALVFIHVLGVVVTSVLHRENLVAAMVTGRKRIE